jgi:hypothetical protein
MLDSKQTRFSEMTFLSSALGRTKLSVFPNLQSALFGCQRPKIEHEDEDEFERIT